MSSLKSGKLNYDMGVRAKPSAQKPKRQIKIIHQNMQMCSNKGEQLEIFIGEENPDIICLTKHGLSEDETSDYTLEEIKVQDIIKEAVTARELAYCPYSNFQVGAALQCSDGTVYTGCNVENSSYGLSICAERTAVVKAISSGNTSYKAIAIVANLESNPSFVSPCGACRQFMAEFGTDIIVYLTKPDLLKVQITSVHELLPFSFKF